MLHERVQRTLESEARRSLANALSPLPGPKGLLVDQALFDPRLSIVRPLDLFTDATFLREHGIRAVASLSAHGGRAMTDILAQPSLVILIRGVNAAAARAAVTAIRRIRECAETSPPEESKILTAIPPSDATRSDPVSEDRQADANKVKCLVLTTPRRSKLVEKVLRTAGLSDVPVSPLPLGFLPFDADLVTLDWPEAYRQIVLEGDNSAILASAAALSSMASSLNLEFSTIRTAGAAATAVAEELLQTHGQMYPRQNRGATSESVPSSVQSSPLISGHQAAASAFATHGAFTMLDAGSAVLDQDEDPLLETPTLADIVGNSSKRRAVNLVIIDRGVDVVSPLLTQWTYEGLLDEAVGLRNNVMDLPISSILSEDAIGILSSGPNASGSGGAVRKRLRGDLDPIFGQLRDLNYWAAARQIGSVASSVRDYYKARPTRETAEIAQVKDYVKGLKEVKSEHWLAAAHTAIAAEISARTFDSYEFKRRFELEREMMEGSTATARCIYITDAIARGESLPHVLRLSCLWSLTSSGIDGDELDFIRKEILAVFGLGVLPLLANLERAGMLVRSLRETAPSNLSWIPFPNFGGGSSVGRAGSDSASTIGSTSSLTMGSDEGRRRARAEYSWQFARAALRLVTDFDPEKAVMPGTSGALSAPYSGYTPLSARLVEAGLSEEGWDSLPHIVAHTSLLPPGHTTVEHRRGEFGAARDEEGEDNLDAVILFVGGVARAEATAVRLAARATGVRLLIGTTAVIAPDEFVLSLNDERV